MEVLDLHGKTITNKIKTHWLEKISPQDLVLIPGDISWAMTLEEAIVDLLWLDALPGTKLLLKGIMTTGGALFQK